MWHYYRGSTAQTRLNILYFFSLLGQSKNTQDSTHFKMSLLNFFRIWPLRLELLMIFPFKCVNLSAVNRDCMPRNGSLEIKGRIMKYQNTITPNPKP